MHVSVILYLTDVSMSALLSVLYTCVKDLRENYATKWKTIQQYNKCYTTTGFIKNH